jgi:hypothetical protein
MAKSGRDEAQLIASEAFTSSLSNWVVAVAQRCPSVETLRMPTDDWPAHPAAALRARRIACETSRNGSGCRCGAKRWISTGASRPRLLSHRAIGSAECGAWWAQAFPRQTITPGRAAPSSVRYGVEVRLPFGARPNARRGPGTGEDRACGVRAGLRPTRSEA